MVQGYFDTGNVKEIKKEAELEKNNFEEIMKNSNCKVPLKSQSSGKERWKKQGEKVVIKSKREREK